MPGGSVRTPGEKPPYPLGRVLFAATLGPNKELFAYGALPAAGSGGTRTTAVRVPAGPGADGIRRTAELVLGWTAPTVGAIAYRWTDGSETRPGLHRLPGSDRLWFLTQGPPGAKSKGYDVYDLADRRTAGRR
ncbi:hypothetical protein ACIQM4_28795 [Streptomyces sp. NPDC091272]|uniref:hypothetical protein n=1 Tax=Streptomyces sp. NPDC091272 TaxID=3365981 RepID=UPI00382C079A